MRKNDLVRLDINKCFTVAQAGKRTYPLTHSHADQEGWITGTRLATQADKDKWRMSDAHVPLDSAGETKLPPTSRTVKLYRDRVYTLLRARCRPVWNYRQQPGMAMILDTETGSEVYVKREFIERVPNASR
jgi:hypothetical protein